MKKVEAAEILEDVAKDYFSCVCSEEYKNRWRIDPACNAHDGVAEKLLHLAYKLRTGGDTHQAL
jgi:hypothetical protein